MSVVDVNQNHSPFMRILGVPVHQINMSQAVDTILGWAQSGGSRYVCIRDVHGVVQAQKSKEIQDIHDGASLVTPDGMPLVWISKLRGSKTIGRVCGSDLVDALCQASQASGTSHFFYGGKDGVAEKMRANLLLKYPQLNVAGTYCPPFRDLTVEEDEVIVQKIRQSDAKIVWVGISTPRQELWMRDHVGKLPNITLIGIGAAFDFQAGIVARAPKWMQRFGMEWLHRLCSEPRRLWKRYLVMAPKFLFYSAIEQVSLATRRS